MNLLVGVLVALATALFFESALGRLQLLIGRGAGGGRGSERPERPEAVIGPLTRHFRSKRPSIGDNGVDDGLVMDLVAVGLHSGLAPNRALEVVAAAVGEGGADLATLGRSLLLEQADEAISEQPDDQHSRRSALTRDIASTIRFAHLTGAPAAGLIQSRVEELRRRRVREAQAAAGRLGVRLVLPLGLCILPAFIALGVMPVVISLVSDLATAL
ncbi:hypothetical protein LWF01_13230 [Saxibacter everestensis]|uniref:Type II secretion system protein GspF domain-containing protein n=1 Tax=Saxibacter everestensis TaxID=2909229 RepID=A0ABY8QQ05_9MICO|nr:hypothetical protein LWF01_13230 [Brevibacteriaceae bacterium ZFBP1038]